MSRYPDEADMEGTYSFDNCARCGERHEDLVFEDLERPAPSADDAYTAWCPCPTNGQPILVEVLEQPETPEGEGRVFAEEDDLEGLAFRTCRKTARAEAVRIDEPFVVHTREGDMRGKAGDYLMRGAAGELYPCDATIFADTYAWDDE